MSRSVQTDDSLIQHDVMNGGREISRAAQGVGMSIQMFKTPKRSKKTMVGHTNFLVRMPDSLLERVKSFAKAGHHSATAEVVRRLEASMVNESIDEHGVIVVHSATPIK